jgi:flagellar hook protein FlgE
MAGNLDSGTGIINPTITSSVSDASLYGLEWTASANPPAAMPSHFQVRLTSDFDNADTAMDVEYSTDGWATSHTAHVDLVDIDPATAGVQRGFRLFDDRIAVAIPTGNIPADTTYSFTNNAYWSTALTVYDSLGNAHPLDLNFVRTQESPSLWSWSLSSTENNTYDWLASGNISFNANGTILSGKTASVHLDPQNGSNLLDFTLDFSRMKQVATDSSASMDSQNGYPVGVLDEFSVGSDGLVTGVFDNERTMVLGQVALAGFFNPSGLIKVGDSAFAETLSSGQPSVGSADDEGRGGIQSMRLEMSNVDLSDEFTDMIVTQRGFEANTKVITASDEILQDLLNLKR